jgi:hypothetical protein
MSTVPFCPLRRFLHLISALLLTLAASGCGDDGGVGPTFPVAGKVTLDDEPLTAKTTIVLFKPDATKGNTTPFEPAGSVDAEGNYTLKTKGKNGAPPGWYRAIVTAREEAAPEHPQNPKQHRPVSKSLLPAKYGQPETAGLSIEVVEKPAPGAYDLKLSR